MASLEPPIPAATATNFIPDTCDIRSERSIRVGMKDMDKSAGKGRRTFGFVLLTLVIFLWTATNFLASAVLADRSFSQPFCVTYINTLFFILPLPPALLHKAYKHPEEWREWIDEVKDVFRGNYARLRGRHAENDGHKSRRDSLEGSRETLLGEISRDVSRSVSPQPQVMLKSLHGDKLSLLATAKLALEFCFLWFLACYFLLVSLEHTTVASSTILTSTASGFCLMFGALLGVERFTLKKLLSVVLSFAGVILIASVDFSGKSSDEEHRGHFPEKSTKELALGNTLALLSSAIYAIYIVRMKFRIPDDSKISMPIFFGFIGLSNALIMWPGFFILHWTGLEPFILPPSERVTWILVANGAGSMVSDIAWAYAVLLTSPILVTVGLSMTIPLTLVGQMVFNAQTSTFVYWIGATVMVLSFAIVSNEEQKEETVRQLDERDIGR